MLLFTALSIHVANQFQVLWWEAGPWSCSLEEETQKVCPYFHHLWWSSRNRSIGAFIEEIRRHATDSSKSYRLQLCQRFKFWMKNYAAISQYKTDVNHWSCISLVNPLIFVNLADVYICIFSWDQAALRTLLSVHLSVRPSHLFDNVPVIVSSWNFQEILPLTDVMFMQKVKVKGQGHRGRDPT